jgi:peptide/nickel transport system substrate-binding protein
MRLSPPCLGAGLTCGFAALFAALAGCAPEPPAPPPDRPLRIALHGGPSSLDPHLQSEVPAQIVLGHIYDSLVDFDPRLRPIPSLAERWENPDALTWRFHLRQGPKFHDGRPLEMADVLFTLERARRHPKSRQAGALVAVSAIEQVGERSLELRTAEPYPILLNKLANLSIVPRGSPEEIADPVGTGRYRVLRRAAGEIELEAVADHWRLGEGQTRRYPRLAKLFFVDGGEERIAGLMGGRYDLADDLSASLGAGLAGEPEVRLESLSSLGVTYLQLDLRKKPWDDLRVRQAIDLLLDRGQLVRAELDGRGQPVGQLVSPNVFGFNPALEPSRRDVARARRLLAEAGHEGGLEIEIEYRDGRDIGEIARQLAEGGVRATGVTRPWAEMYRRLQSGEIGAYLGTWICTSGDASDLLDRKLHTPDPARGWGDANWSRYSNPELDLLIEASQRVTNPAERGALLKKAMALAAADLAFLPIYSRAEVYGVRRQLDWTPRRDGRIYAFETSWAFETSRR